MNVRASTISNVRWAGTSQIFRLLTQFVGIAVLTKILAVADFGLMAMASVVTVFAALFSDMGMGAAIVQKQKLTPRFLNTVFWSNAVFGISIGVIVAAICPIAAIAFSQPKLTGLLLLLALIFPISALGTVHLAKLERGGRFKSIALIEILASSLGLVVALILAWAGAGVYAFAGQALATAVIITTAYWILSGWRPQFAWRLDEIRSVWHFGGNLTGFNVINYFSRNSDNMLIGATLGPADLGIYNLAFRLMSLPTQTLTASINRVLFPVYSERIRTGNGISDYFLKIISLVSLLTAPVMFGLWAIREPFIDVLLGPQWAQSATVLAWLAPAGFLHAMLSPTGSVFMATGRTDLLAKTAFVATVAILLSFAIGINFGITGMAAAYLVSSLFTFALGFYVTLRLINVSAHQFIKVIWLPVVSALTMAALVMFLEDQLIARGLSETLRLLTLVPTAAIFYFGLIALLSWRSIKELLNIVGLSKQT